MKLPKIYGFNKSSDGGPSPFGVSVFLSGCNMYCPYCLNSKLVEKINLNEICLDDILKHIIDNNISWVTISGGEPTIHSGLKNLIMGFFDMGVKINLSTNGLKPDIVESVINYLHYVTLDLKTANHDLYLDWTKDGTKHPFDNVLITKSILERESKRRCDDFNYEIRTTVVPKYINELEMYKLIGIIRNDEKWVLQKFRINKYVSEEAGIEDDSIAEKFLNLAKNNGKKAEIRYI